MSEVLTCKDIPDNIRKYCCGHCHDDSLHHHLPLLEIYELDFKKGQEDRLVAKLCCSNFGSDRVWDYIGKKVRNESLG